mmetsp:Transcript_104238/g.185208  ORF Transcript_104238/g.185208 Transcript_104238/m.185208 type:complete len:1111 (-) Transcript_104238:238-3570(-)
MQWVPPGRSPRVVAMVPTSQEARHGIARMAGRSPSPRRQHLLQHQALSQLHTAGSTTPTYSMQQVLLKPTVPAPLPVNAARRHFASPPTSPTSSIRGITKTSTRTAPAKRPDVDPSAPMWKNMQMRLDGSSLSTIAPESPADSNTMGFSPHSPADQLVQAQHSKQSHQQQFGQLPEMSTEFTQDETPVPTPPVPQSPASCDSPLQDENKASPETPESSAAAWKKFQDQGKPRAWQAAREQAKLREALELEGRLQAVRASSPDLRTQQRLSFQPQERNKKVTIERTQSCRDVSDSLQDSGPDAAAGIAVRKSARPVPGADHPNAQEKPQSQGAKVKGPVLGARAGHRPTATSPGQRARPSMPKDIQGRPTGTMAAAARLAARNGRIEARVRGCSPPVPRPEQRLNSSPSAPEARRQFRTTGGRMRSPETSPRTSPQPSRHSVKACPTPPTPSAPQSSRTQQTQSDTAAMHTSVVPNSNLIREVLADERQLKHYASMCFKAFDENGDGVLNYDELRCCIERMNTNLGIPHFTDRHVKQYLRRFDFDGNELLDRAEYEQLYRSLLLVKLDELEPANFSREMFISRRKGKPEDHYRIQGVLGKGSFGVVRKAQCKQTQVIRVLKTVDKQKALSGGYPLSLIMEEIDKLKSLDHPAVLRLFEYFADARALYLITDLLPGGDLLEAVETASARKKPLSERWVCDVFRQACEGVAYCHAKGVMHKDLKLENIMLCSVEPPEAVVIDVGLAELFPPSQAESFHSADAAGTLATMAPEVIRGSFSAKCDVWSLGCCLFALLCQRPRRLKEAPDDGTLDDSGTFYDYFYPFRPPNGESRPELKAYIERQKRGPDLARLRCSAAADDLIEQLLTCDDNFRPAMKKVLTHPWLQSSRVPDQVLGTEQLDSLLQFHRTNALAQAVLLDMASQLPLGKLRQLTSLFESMDKDGNGMLDGPELTEALQKAGLDADSAAQAAMRLAQDGGGSVEFSRFVAALVPSCRDLLQRELLQSSFDRLDANGDGYVSRAELQRLIERGAINVLAAQQQLLATKEGPKPTATATSAGSRRATNAADSSDEERATPSDSRRLRAEKAARRAFDTISGEGRVRVSFESFQKLFDI